jgi:hypothetical protein
LALPASNGSLPPRRRFSSKGPQRRSGDEVALKVERVMDGGVHIEKALFFLAVKVSLRVDDA